MNIKFTIEIFPKNYFLIEISTQIRVNLQLFTNKQKLLFEMFPYQFHQNNYYIKPFNLKSIIASQA